MMGVETALLSLDLPITANRQGGTAMIEIVIGVATVRVATQRTPTLELDGRPSLSRRRLTAALSVRQRTSAVLGLCGAARRRRSQPRTPRRFSRLDRNRLRPQNHGHRGAGSQRPRACNEMSRKDAVQNDPRLLT